MIFQLLLSLAILSVTYCYTSDKIIGGHEIEIEEAPYQVATFYNASQFCGGSLISSKFVLSAAHCFYDHVPDRILTVYIGSNKLKDGSGMSINVRYIYNHPKYNPTNLENDFSLLRLYDVDNFPSVVQFVKLPTVFDKLSKGDKVFVSGWGRTELSISSEVLLGATVKVVKYKDCKEQYEKMNIKITEAMICAGRDGGNYDACQGDSGGPLVRESDGILFGVVSFGIGCGLPDYPGVYAKVSNALGWIYNIVNYSDDWDKDSDEKESNELTKIIRKF